MMGIGMYTSILAITLWNICEPGISPLWHPSWSWMSVINKCWQIRQGLVVVIILLHGLTTINFAVNWSYVPSAFIENGKSFWTVYLKLSSPTQSAYLVGGIASAMSTITTDLYMVCATWWELSTWAHHCSDCRFGAAAWFGDSTGLLFYFQYFP